MLRLLTSPLIHEHLSHASSVIVGDYAKSTAEAHCADEEGPHLQGTLEGEGGSGEQGRMLGFGLQQPTLGDFGSRAEQEKRRSSGGPWNDVSGAWEGGTSCEEVENGVGEALNGTSDA